MVPVDLCCIVDGRDSAVLLAINGLTSLFTSFIRIHLLVSFPQPYTFSAPLFL
jgi:hypothetical protein